MKYTISEAIQLLSKLRNGETIAEYEKRQKKLKRLYNELYDLQDGIDVLERYGNSDKDTMRLDQKRKRLTVVKRRIEELT